MSHVFVIDAPDYPRPLFVTEAAINQLTGGILDGPLAFDNAVSEEACKTKGIVSLVGGRADILVVPDIEAGNMLAKQLEYLAEVQIAGIVLGARVPIIILTSRVDKTPARLGSCAIALLLARHETEVKS
jgi:phosphotransacetylase